MHPDGWAFRWRGWLGMTVHSDSEHFEMLWTVIPRHSTASLSTGTVSWCILLWFNPARKCSAWVGAKKSASRTRGGVTGSKTALGRAISVSCREVCCCFFSLTLRETVSKQSHSLWKSPKTAPVEGRQSFSDSFWLLCASVGQSELQSPGLYHTCQVIISSATITRAAEAKTVRQERSGTTGCLLPTIPDCVERARRSLYCLQIAPDQAIWGPYNENSVTRGNQL